MGSADKLTLKRNLLLRLGLCRFLQTWPEFSFCVFASMLRFGFCLLMSALPQAVTQHFVFHETIWVKSSTVLPANKTDKCVFLWALPCPQWLTMFQTSWSYALLVFFFNKFPSLSQRINSVVQPFKPFIKPCSKTAMSLKSIFKPAASIVYFSEPSQHVAMVIYKTPATVKLLNLKTLLQLLQLMECATHFFWRTKAVSVIFWHNSQKTLGTLVGLLIAHLPSQQQNAVLLWVGKLKNCL